MNKEFLNSKYPLVLGGFLGFSLAFFVGYYAGNEILHVLKNAAIASVVGAFLMKIFHNVVIYNLKMAFMERARREESEEEK